MPRSFRVAAASSLVLFGLSVLGLVACQTPGATRIIGPDGSPMAHVHCGSDQGTCFRLAGELCPTGYDMKPVLSSSHGNFLIRCRAATAIAAAPACPTPSPAALGLPAPAAQPSGAALSATQSTPTDNWPPSTEPWPAAYPWGPPEASAVVKPLPAKPSSQEPDLGY